MGYLIALFVVLYILEYLITKTPDVEIGVYAVIGYLTFKFVRYVVRKWKGRRDRRKRNEQFHQAEMIYQTLRDEVVIPPKHTKVFFLSTTWIEHNLFMGLMYCWLEKRTLCLFPYPPTRNNYYHYHQNLDVVRIPVSRILEYKQDGQIVYHNDITGGDIKVKASSSIIGSDAKAKSSIEVQPIQSQLRVSDYRNMTMLFKDEQGDIQEMVLSYDSYPYLKELLPVKDAVVVNEKQVKKFSKVQLNTKKNVETDELTLLKEYADLYERGILTKKELEKKKKELLNKSLVK